ncbi:MAG: Lrp/AsnC ligand binding domain-containing protein [Thermomicrobiales bacterium]|nr:Lrp/AsnC ligand binding domain-containing protein [Thermomicrobiales bacterium]
MRAYVLITIEAGRGTDVQNALRAAGIDQVDQVAGTYDVVAVIESEDPKRIGELVISKIQQTDGVVSTVTLLTIG